MVPGMRCLIAAGLVAVAGAGGCVDRTPPPPDAPVPQTRGNAFRDTDPVKPDARPGEDEQAYAGGLPPPPFTDEPLVVQDTPEMRAFVEAYNAVGRPRIVVFVNRTLDGAVIPADHSETAFSDGPRRNGGERTVEARDRLNTDDRYRNDYADPFENRDLYLQPGQYDPAVANEIDYQAVEAILTDWLAVGGRTEIISPLVARQRLSDRQVQDLQNGRPQVMADVARDLDADVLVHVTARPTRQTRRGLELRLVAEAINIGRGGQSVGRAVVDVPPPLDKPKINKFTRFLARMLMDRMIGTWENMPAPTRDGVGGGAPRVEPGRPEEREAPLPPLPPLPPGPPTTSPQNQ